jgi:hypothetical protein
MHTLSSGGLRHHPYYPRICRAFPTLRLGPAPSGLNSGQRRQLPIVSVNVIEELDGSSFRCHHCTVEDHHLNGFDKIDVKGRCAVHGGLDTRRVPRPRGVRQNI